MKSVTVVIPTRNRPEQIRRLIRELSLQSRLPDEIIVVDASEDTGYRNEIYTTSGIPLKWIDSNPHVCVQRNLGIQHAGSDWIFLCDDDIGLPANYIKEVEQIIDTNKDCGIACGLLMQKDDQGWRYDYPVKSTLGLLWAYVFQLPLWGRVSASTPGWLRNYFEKRGNHVSKAGWPVLTDFHGPFFTTPYYSLGANIVRRDWLLQSPFDEALDPHGIGDNYGVIVGFPEGARVFVTHQTSARHYQSTINRLAARRTTYLRLIALKRFIVKGSDSTRIMMWYRWSLIGRSIFYLLKGKIGIARETFAAMIYSPPGV